MWRQGKFHTSYELRVHSGLCITVWGMTGPEIHTLLSNLHGGVSRIPSQQMACPPDNRLREGCMSQGETRTSDNSLALLSETLWPHLCLSQNEAVSE